MLSVFGISIHKDFCCGKLKSTTLYFKPQEKKSCKAKSMKGCCRTENVFYKLSTQHENASVNISISHFETVAIVHHYNFLSDEAAVTERNYTGLINAPPLTLSSPTYLLNCNFRI